MCYHEKEDNTLYQVVVNRLESKKKKKKEKKWGKKTNEYTSSCVNGALLKPTQQRTYPAHSVLPSQPAARYFLTPTCTVSRSVFGRDKKN